MSTLPQRRQQHGGRLLWGEKLPRADPAACAVRARRALAAQADLRGVVAQLASADKAILVNEIAKKLLSAFGGA